MIREGTSRLGCGCGCRPGAQASGEGGGRGGPAVARSAACLPQCARRRLTGRPGGGAHLLEDADLLDGHELGLGTAEALVNLQAGCTPALVTPRRHRQGWPATCPPARPPRLVLRPARPLTRLLAPLPSVFSTWMSSWLICRWRSRGGLRRARLRGGSARVYLVRPVLAAGLVQARRTEFVGVEGLAEHFHRPVGVDLPGVLHAGRH